MLFCDLYAELDVHRKMHYDATVWENNMITKLKT